MSHQDRFISGRRRGMSDAENDLMDNLLAGRVDRRGFLAHGSRLGLSLPLLGGIAGAMGLAAETRPARAAGPSGGTLRVAMTLPTGAIDPITIADQGGLFMLEQAGEFLIKLSPDYTLEPVLATSWSPNTDGSVWTFKLRSGVKFNNGEPFNADAVVTSVERLVDPKNSSNALSAFKGVLSPGASRKVDDLTVAFHLDAPNGNFPYVLSSDNYNLVMLPASYTGNYETELRWHRPLQDRQIHPQSRCILRTQRRLLGAEGAARPPRIHLLQRYGAAGSGLAGRRCGYAGADDGSRRPRHSRQSKIQGHFSKVERA